MFMGNIDFKKIFYLYKRFVNSSKPYPSMVNTTIYTAGVGTWQLGSFVETIPVNTITTDYTITKIQCAAVSAVSSYEVVLYSGLAGSEIEICRTRLAAGTGTNAVLNLDVVTPILPANTRISAKIAYALGGTATLAMSVIYIPMN